MAGKKILITGANGQLGNEFRELASQYPGYEFIFLSRQELQIESAESVQQVFAKHKPDWCVNCAAYTAVDKAESEKEAAFAINATAAGTIAQACAANNTGFIHISTDYVFDGASAEPYKEDEPTGPINTYGHSKLMGEQLVMQHNPNAVIIRTAWVYSQFGNNFVKTMMRLMKERESINVVEDQVGSPTYAADLAEAIMHIIEGGCIVPGIYHYSNEGRISWHQFALAIKEMINSNCIVNPIPSSQYPTPARRPQYSLLDKSKIKAVFGVKVPEWRERLSVVVDKVMSESQKSKV